MNAFFLAFGRSTLEPINAQRLGTQMVFVLLFTPFFIAELTRRTRVALLPDITPVLRVYRDPGGLNPELNIAPSTDTAMLFFTLSTGNRHR